MVAGTDRASSWFMRTHLWFALITACATTPRPEPRGGPRGLYASDHVAEARDHQAQGTRQAAWPDARSAQPDHPDTGVWFGTWDINEHERLAETHRASALALQKQYEDRCSEVGATDASISPLRRYGVSGWNTASGVVVYLSPGAGTPERLLTELRCHRAWMMLAPAGMEDCPLDLPGLIVDARGDTSGVTLSISVGKPALVGELQRRTALELESKGAQTGPAPR
jgi:hypothetical protein